MKLENLNKVAKLKEELDELEKCFDEHMYWNHPNANHFEFVEHYGSNPYRAKISKSLNEKIFLIIKERIKEIKEEIETL